jgi:hypothetical protein
MRKIRIGEAHSGEARSRRVALLHRAIGAIDIVSPAPAPFLQAERRVPAVSLGIGWNRRQNRERCQNRQSQNTHQKHSRTGNLCLAKSSRSPIVPNRWPNSITEGPNRPAPCRLKKRPQSRGSSWGRLCRRRGNLGGFKRHPHNTDRLPLVFVYLFIRMLAGCARAAIRTYPRLRNGPRVRSGPRRCSRGQPELTRRRYPSAQTAGTSISAMSGWARSRAASVSLMRRIRGNGTAASIRGHIRARPPMEWPLGQTSGE